MRHADRVDQSKATPPESYPAPTLNHSSRDRDPVKRIGTPDVRGSRGAISSRGAANRPGPIGRKTAGVHAFFTKELWSRELASLPTFRRWGYGVARVVHLTITNFINDRCTWRASALTYITVLSLVPMLALGFSVAKGMGAYETLLNQTIVPFLDSTFGPAEGDVVAAVEEVIDEAIADGELSGDGGEASDVATSEDGEPTPDGDVSVGDAATDSATEAPPGDASTSDDGAQSQGSQAGAGGEPQPGEETQPGEGTEPGTGDPADAGDEPEGADEPADGELSEDIADEARSEATGSEVRRAIDTVLGFVQSTDVSRLGVLGLLIVIYTVIKLLGSVELSFNDIWGVRKARSLPRKIADYLSTIVLVPLLLVTGTGVRSLARSERFESFLGTGGESPIVTFFSSMAVVWLGFGFAYILMPNTRTKITSALVGGVVGGTMWQLFQWAHLELQVGVANYNAIYSTFAALPIFLFWVQSSWMTVLLGAEAAAAHQNQARYGQLVRSRDYDLALKEVVALRLAVRVARSFLAGGPPQRYEDLADDLGCPERTLEEVARGLERGRIVATVDAEGGDDDPALILASDPEFVRVQDVLDALKGDSLADVRADPAVDGNPIDQATDRAFARFRQQRDETGANVTLRELAIDGAHADHASREAAATAGDGNAPRVQPSAV